MNVSFEEIGLLAVTISAEESMKAGQVCKLDASGKAVACSAGDSFIGVAEGVRKGHAAVQVAGFVRVNYTGTKPALGYVNLCADGAGNVKTGSGREYLAVCADEQTVTIML